MWSPERLAGRVAGRLRGWYSLSTMLLAIFSFIAIAVVGGILVNWRGGRRPEYRVPEAVPPAGFDGAPVMIAGLATESLSCEPGDGSGADAGSGSGADGGGGSCD